MDRPEFEEKLRQVTDRIVADFKPRKIILFGSWAWGEPGPDSDVDLFIVQDTENTREFARAIDGSIFPRPFPIDLIVYRPEQVERERRRGDFFIEDIFTKGKILYAR